MPFTSARTGAFRALGSLVRSESGEKGEIPGRKPTTRSDETRDARVPSEKKVSPMRVSTLFKAFAAVIAGISTSGELALGSPEDAKISVLRLEQSTRGIPRRGEDGSRDTKTPIHQVLWLDAAGQRVRLEQYAKKGDPRPEVIYVLQPAADGKGLLTREFPNGGKRYRERRGDFNDFQKKRRIREREMLRKIATYPGAEREEALKFLHLRPDGKRIVTVKQEKAPQRLGRDCRHLEVTENGRVILKADVTTPPAGAAAGEGRGYFEMYRRLGIFSDEVIEKLKDVKGIPLRGEITVVTDLAPYTLTVEVAKLEERTVASDFFDVPKGAEKIPDIPPISICPICSRKFETENAGARLFDQGKTIYVCSAKCFRELDKKLNEERRRR
jgi:YHS domain-containing protein